jgi:hypothetical protein
MPWPRRDRARHSLIIIEDLVKGGMEAIERNPGSRELRSDYTEARKLP